MSSTVREFVRQSGVDVQSSNSNSNDDNFARELEETMLRSERERAAGFRTPQRRPVRVVPRQVQIPERLQRNLVNNRTYEGAFKEFENNSPLDGEFNDLNANTQKMINNIAREFDEPPLGNTPLEISKLNPGMFNATVDSGFGQKDVLVKISNILMKTPRSNTPIGEGLYVDTVEIKGIYGQFTTGFSHTREAGPKGDINKNFFTAQLMLTLSNGIESKGATVNFYRNGKIRFSGGFVGTNIENQPELIRRYVVDMYTDKQPFFYNPFTYNNLSGQFRVNGFFRSLPEIARNAMKYGMSRVNYEPELSPFLYAYFGENKYILSTSGNIQISGAKNPGDMARAYDFGKKFVRDLYSDNQINVTGVFDKGVKLKAKPKAKPKAKSPPKTKRIYVKRVLTANQANAVMIDGKICARMKKPELLDFARRMGVVNFRTKLQDGSRAATKDEICVRIKNKTGKKNVTFKNKNKNVPLTGSNKTFKVGRKTCGDMTKGELIRIAAILNIIVDKKETKVDICKKIEMVRNRLNIPKTPPPPKRTKMAMRKNEAAAKRNVKKTETTKKRGLDENSIRKDIIKLYGVTWLNRYKPNLNQDVRNIKSALNLVNKRNASGVVFKRDADAVKKAVVSQWKRDRRRELEKKYLMNNINVTGIAFNLKNEYKRAAANYIMTNLVNQKKKPTDKRMAAYRKYWLKFRANMNNNGNSKGINRTARARVEKI